MKRVFFHVGAPKSGTTFLQDLMRENREQLASDGLFYPFDTPSAQLFVALGLMERPWGGEWKPEWADQWRATARAIRESDCDRAVLSSEVLGLATAEQARRAVAAVHPAEVHVVFTARDLARQLPSDWQEQVKHRHTVTLTKFIDDLVELGIDAPKPFGEFFWGLHDPVRVLANWSPSVAPERIHVVTVPPPGTAPTVLWGRLARLFDLDPTLFELDDVRRNRSMGLLETEFLRRFNGVSHTMLDPSHGPVINRVLGQSVLANADVSEPARLPDRHRPWVMERSRQLVDALAQSGYDIVGSLEELMPIAPDVQPAETVPESLPPGALMRAAHPAVAGLLREIVSLRGVIRGLRAALAERETTDPTARGDPASDIVEFD